DGQKRRDRARPAPVERQRGARPAAAEHVRADAVPVAQPALLDGDDARERERRDTRRARVRVYLEPLRDLVEQRQPLTPARALLRQRLAHVIQERLFLHHAWHENQLAHDSLDVLRTAAATREHARNLLREI